ncbi:MAG: hypothetical protein GIKADHBN_02699 [Phycisphaerales bacterium]|nr:hypothetical protein [Phycisphaerales bacterium]
MKSLPIIGRCIGLFVCVLAATGGAAEGQLTPIVADLEESSKKSFYVTPAGNDSNNGQTVAKAFRTIQKAVNAASKAGTVIYVAPGTYKETVTLGSGVKSGSPAKPIAIVGDVKGVETGWSPGEVIIDGQGSRQYGIQLGGPDHWTFTNLRITGQTVANVYTTASDVSGITLDDCTFDVTTSWGLYFANCGNVAVTDCVFNRTAKSGHATYLYQTSGDTMIVAGNRMSLKGKEYLSTGFRQGRLWYNGGSFTSASYCYGIIAMAYNTATPMKITVQNNVISDAYLGVYVYNYGDKKSSTMTVSHNTSVGCYYGMYVYSDSKTTATITNNITGDCYLGAYVYSPLGTLDGHLAYNLTYNPCKADTWKGCAYVSVAKLGTVVLQQTPEFADAAGGDFSLTGTVGIDAGVPLGATSADVMGTRRPVDGDGDGNAVVDIGAFESTEQEAKTLRIIKWEEVGVDEE